LTADVFRLTLPGMDERAFADVDRRVARLESQLRVWRVLAAAALALAGFAAFEAGGHSQLVTTRRVVLVDRAGVERAWFGLAEDDTPHIELYDAQGADVAGIGVTANGTVEVDWPAAVRGHPGGSAR
jgi:hypothetical protein